MENRIEILNELRELSTVIADMEKINIFSVPAGYFDSMSDDILASLKETNSNSLSLSYKTSLQAPAGYFDTLADTVLARIKTAPIDTATEELRMLSPMLYSIQNENVFEVPRGYFDSVAETMIEKIKPVKTKVISIRRFTGTITKYAVAAAFTGVMALGVFKFTGNSKGTIDPVIAEGTQIAKENKFEEELAKVTDADIVKYLEANGSDVNAALVANSVDENKLPSQEDYFSDEKALDKYLNSININDLKN